ncbi:MAG: fold metallo-hydrolase, partial [Candidatus Poribacteria bacterium]|nr:fold metallo-hydrolase [Candidatus Poribacteria bacterium]
KKIGEKWLITDDSPENDKIQHVYHIIKENGKLNVYENRQTALIYGLAVLTVFCWAMAMMYDGHVAKITYLDVGEGDSIYAEMPDNYKILIDGGSYREGYSLGERVVAPFLKQEGVGNLDLMVSTHPDNDHTGGLTYILDNFHVKKILTGSYGLTSPTYKEFLNRLNGTQSIDAKPEVIHDNKDIKIEVLSDQYRGVLKNEDSRMNNNSVVLKLTYKEASFLFTGDIQKEGERQLVNSGRDVKATVLKVAHHGSGSSSSYDFIRAVQPTVAVISVGYRNFYNHPSPYVIARYDRSGVKIYRTDKQGAVTIITNGRYGWIKTMSQ